MAFPEVFPILAPDVLTPAGQVDHAATSTGKLAEFIRTQPNFLALLGVALAQVTDLETAFQQLLHLRSLDDASGGQLDDIGEILRQPRDGRSDALYRKFLAARILLNRSSGTIPEILQIFDLITNGVLVLTEWPPAAFELHLYGPVTSTEAAAFALMLQRARAAGVGGAFHWTEWPEADTFTLDGTPAQSLDAGHLSGIAL